MKWPSKTLINHTYKNGYRLHVTTKGFTLWDAELNTWVVDASCLVKDNEITIGSALKKEQADYGNINFIARKVCVAAIPKSARTVRRKTARPTKRKPTIKTAAVR